MAALGFSPEQVCPGPFTHLLEGELARLQKHCEGCGSLFMATPRTRFCDDCNHQRALEVQRRYRERMGRKAWRAYQNEYRQKTIERRRMFDRANAAKKRHADPEAHREKLRVWRLHHLEEMRERDRKRQPVRTVQERLWRRMNPDAYRAQRKALHEKSKPLARARDRVSISLEKEILGEKAADLPSPSSYERRKFRRALLATALETGIINREYIKERLK
jgi:hypothetical protein